MKRNKAFIKTSFLFIPLALCTTIISCSKSDNENAPFDFYKWWKHKNPNLNKNDFFESISQEADKTFMPLWQNWFDNLSINMFKTNQENKFTDLFCNSERQALALYATCWGHYWNAPLHQGRPVVDYKIEPNRITIPSNLFSDPQNVWVNGNGYKFIQEALSKSISPVSLVTYHGVEWMETEFWDQLKQFIKINPDNSYNYEGCKGKTIETKGFISTTLNKEWAMGFADGKNWLENDTPQPPLKEPAIFEISIYKGGGVNCAYISGFRLMEQNNMSMINNEAQFLINIGCRFKIKNVRKENNVNIFEVDLLN